MSKINDDATASTLPYSERRGRVAGSINDGGAAFPQSGYEQWAPMPGMSLRDYFAVKAMQGIFSCPQLLQRLHTDAGVAKSAYETADAMLAAREVAK